MNDVLTQCRPASRRLIAMLLIATAGCSIIVNLWFFPSGLWKPVWRQTGGLVHPTLLAALFSIGVQVVLIIMLIAGHRPREIGLQVSKLPSGLLWVVVVWATLQATAVGVWFVSGGSPSIDDAWTRRGSGAIGGVILGQLFGNALYEETVFRGFLFAQCIAVMKRSAVRLTRTRLFAAMLLCAVLFSVSHMPNRLMKERYVSLAAVTGDQVRLVVMGCFFCWLYFQTRNLLFVIGVHSLANYPTMLITMPGGSDVAKGESLVLAVILALLWSRLPGQRAAQRPPPTGDRSAIPVSTSCQGAA